MPLGDVRQTLIDVLTMTLPYGRAAVTQKVDETLAYLRSQAEQGAKQAIPTIKSEVEKVVKKYVLPAAAVAGGLGLLGVVVGVLASRRCAKGCR